MIIILFFTAMLVSAQLNEGCLNPEEQVCTRCSPTYVLVKGKCFSKVRGCLEYDLEGEGIVCVECQNGYKEDGGRCVREVVGGLEPSPLVFGDGGKLTIDDVLPEESNPEQIPEQPKQTSNLSVYQQIVLQYPHLEGIPIIQEQQKNKTTLIKYENGDSIVYVPTSITLFENQKQKTAYQTIKRKPSLQILRSASSISYQIDNGEGFNISIDDNGRISLLTPLSPKQQHIPSQQTPQMSQILQTKQFSTVYSYLLNHAQKPVPSIISNIYLWRKDDITFYNITFNEDTYVVLSVMGEEDVKIMEYVSEGKKIEQLTVMKLAQVENYLQQNWGQIPDQYKIIKFTHEKNDSRITYKIKLLGPSGSQNLTLLQTPLSLSLTATSPELPTCADISLQDPIANNLHLHLQQTHPELTNYPHLLLQYQQQPNSSQYRFLYTNISHHQFQFYIRYNPNIGTSKKYAGKYQIEKSQYLNSNYSRIEPDTRMQKIKHFTIDRYSRYLSSTGEEVFMRNNTNVKIYFSAPTATYTYTFPIDSPRKGILLRIENKEEPIFPVGFDTEKMLSPNEMKSDMNIKKITTKVREKYGFYFANAPIHCAQLHQNQTYDIVFKIKYGYYCVSASADPEILIKSLEKVEMREKKPICLANENNQCVSCPHGHILDSGRCYEKLTGCEVQLGTLCVECEFDWVLVDRQCRRACQQFF